MPVAHKKYFLSSLLLAFAVLALDQWSKAFVPGLFPDPTHPVIEIAPFFNLVMVWNYGISFGMLADHRQPLILAGFAVIILGILCVWLYRNTSRATALGLGFVIGGATGNVIDRLRFGAVADFLDFHIGPYHWPAFNVADSAIFIGVVLLCVHSMVATSKEKDS